MKYKIYNTDQEDELIDIGNQLMNYKPENINEDKFFDLISSDTVVEICWKNKSLIKAIKNKNELNLEEYADVLEAVGFMIRDYCRERLAIYLNIFQSNYKDYNIIETNGQSLLELTMGNPNNDLLWKIKGENGESNLLYWKHSHDNEWVICKERVQRNIGNMSIERLGRLYFLISDNEKKIICLSFVNEIMFIKVDEYYKLKEEDFILQKDWLHWFK